MGMNNTTTELERRLAVTAEFMRKVRAAKPQEWYCKGCVNFGACNVILNNGDECSDRIVPETGK
jgi:hypothetical protein